MKRKLIKILLVAIITIFSFANVNTSYAGIKDMASADKITNLELDQIYNITSSNSLLKAGQYIAGWIYYIAIIACVIVLMLKGIKFITSSPEGKADAKTELMPWAIGIILLFSFRVILNFFISFAQNNINTL